jgi:hypothetical protein
MSGIDIIDLSKQLSSFQSADAAMRKSMDDMIKSVREKMAKLQQMLDTALESDEGISEGLEKETRAKLQAMADLIIMLEKAAKEETIRLGAMMAAELAVQAEERTKGRKLEADEEKALRKQILEAWIRAEHEKTISIQESNVKALESIRDLMEKSITMYASMGAAGAAAGAAFQAGLAGIDLVIGAKKDEIEALRKAMEDSIRSAMAGVDIYRIKSLMRHKTLDMTMRYAHLIPDATREAVHNLKPPTKG